MLLCNLLNTAVKVLQLGLLYSRCVATNNC
nr:MAG TPA: hypothetical protein [Crassvirales sp.]